MKIYFPGLLTFTRIVVFVKLIVIQNIPSIILNHALGLGNVMV